jgi:hypothetical protein
MWNKDTRKKHPAAVCPYQNSKHLLPEKAAEMVSLFLAWF